MESGWVTWRHASELVVVGRRMMQVLASKGSVGERLAGEQSWFGGWVCRG